MLEGFYEAVPLFNPFNLLFNPIRGKKITESIKLVNSINKISNSIEIGVNFLDSIIILLKLIFKLPQ